MMGRRRGEPKRVWHRGRGRGRGGYSALDWAKILGMGGVLLLIIGYIAWLFFFQTAASAADWSVYLPLVTAP
jgi:hypothetical protein